MFRKISKFSWLLETQKESLFLFFGQLFIARESRILFRRSNVDFSVLSIVFQLFQDQLAGDAEVRL